MDIGIDVVDLFAGSGGTTTGIIAACKRLNRRVQLLAINHWRTAIDSHALNHPNVRHLCETLDSIDPRKQAIRLSLLAASPECTHHSNARGGKPRSEQSRATAWQVLRWAEALPVDNILIENVRELQDWGPLDANGKPIKSKKGVIFKAFIQQLRALNYFVEYRVIDCADYGDATHRLRLFILCSKNRKIVWPEPTHGDPADLIPGQLPWRPAREIIDWELFGKSIFNRKKPLRPNTIKRILAGYRKFGARDPFLVVLRGTAADQLERSARSIDQPLPTITAGGYHTALIQPYLIHTTHHGADRVHSLEVPTPTITGAHRGELALVQPRVLDVWGDTEGTLEPVFDVDCCHLVNAAGDTVADIDFLIRMLQPHEMAAAMSFPDGYTFCGNKGDQTKQIGNAVPVSTATELSYALLAPKYGVCNRSTTETRQTKEPTEDVQLVCA